MDKFDLLFELQKKKAEWLIEAAEGGLPYADQLDAFLERMAAADLPAEFIEATRGVLAFKK